MERSTRDMKLWEVGDICEVLGLGGGAWRGTGSSDPCVAHPGPRRGNTRLPGLSG